jgi:TolB protein
VFRLTLWLAGILLAAFAGLVGAALAAGAALPNGGQIAFEAFRQGDWDVYLLDVGRGFAANLTRAHSDGWDRSTAWSPDGTTLAYTSVVGLDNMDIFTRQIQCPSLLLPCDGLHNLTHYAGNDYAPVWSPDGGQIAFVSERDYNREVYVMNRDGGDVRNLSQHPDTDMSPTWSPDGGQIAFVSERDRLIQVYITDTARTTIRSVVGNFSQSLIWSPDGRQMAYLSGGDIYLAATECLEGLLACGSGARNLTQNRYDDTLPSWSPDSQRIMFQSNRPKPQVFVLDIACATGADACMDGVQLSDRLQRQFMPAWSPDGERVVMISDDSGRLELYVLEVGTAGLQRLTNMRTQLYAPRWRPG